MPDTHRQRLARGILSGCNGCAPSRIPTRSGSSSANSPASRSGRKCSGFAIAYVGDREAGNAWDAAEIVLHQAMVVGHGLFLLKDAFNSEG